VGRSNPGRLFLASALCALVSGCDYGSTSPSTAGPARYDGQWSGTTSQGRPITFTVSSEQKVTAIALEYNFNGCSGSQAFSNLNLEIGTSPNPALPSRPTFSFGSGPPDGANYIQVLGTFTGDTTANGSMIFGDFGGCGNAIGIWTATRR
jgi:hypothetical protein